MNLAFLSDPSFVVFTTREYAEISDVAMATASRQLGRAAAAGALVLLTRGVWANPSHVFFHPLSCVPKLLGNEQGYVSFLSALQRKEVIEQIPRAVQVATTGHARKLATPVGHYVFLHLAPALMRRGVEWSDTRVPYRVATADKALLDTFYVSLRRGRRFRSPRARPAADHEASLLGAPRRCRRPTHRRRDSAKIRAHVGQRKPNELSGALGSIALRSAWAGSPSRLRTTRLLKWGGSLAGASVGGSTGSPGQRR
jgi:hypothetical protein